MKKKMLLLASIAATLLSSVLLIAPANAGVAFSCTNCTGLNSKGHKVTVDCEVQPIDSCFCPLTGTILENNCRPIASAP